MAFLSPPAEAAPAKPVSKTAARLDDMKAAYEKQLSALWSAVQPYQTACGVSPPLTQEQFVEGLRQSSLEGTIAARDAAYAADQIEFVKRSLSNGSVITLCKVGKSGIFFAILEYHRRTWDQLRRESKQAEDAEQRRIEEFRRSEFARVAEEHAGGYRWLTLAGIGFASFMSLALVLIFARIESNLRGLKIQR